jgi:hypothetical protein
VTEFVYHLFATASDQPAFVGVATPELLSQAGQGDDGRPAWSGKADNEVQIWHEQVEVCQTKHALRPNLKGDESIEQDLSTVLVMFRRV